LYVAANPALAAISEAELESAAAAMGGLSAATMIVGARAARPGAAPGQIFLDLMTETTFAAPCKALARAIARAGGRAFLYRFDWESPSAALGACHCLGKRRASALRRDTPPRRETFPRRTRLRAALCRAACPHSRDLLAMRPDQK
jgi:hypothetical protein